MNELFRDLWRNQRAMLIASVVFLAATGLLVGLIMFDQTQILGINRWIKPSKFSISAAIFVFTVAIYLTCLEGLQRSKSIIAWGTIVLMYSEVILVTAQAARGTTSHFNTANAFNGLIYSMMGLLIAIQTFLILYLTFLYFTSNAKIPVALSWGLRLGLIVFLLGSVQGGYMAAQPGHTVGAGDGGAGLPFVNWSTTAGDLRVAHFLGLHALQIIPLFSLLMIRLKDRLSFIKPTALTFAFAALYLFVFIATFAQALYGKAVLG